MNSESYEIKMAGDSGWESFEASARSWAVFNVSSWSILALSKMSGWLLDQAAEGKTVFIQLTEVSAAEKRLDEALQHGLLWPAAAGLVNRAE